MNEGDLYLADYATTHTILRNKRYFLNLILTNANVITISGIANLIKGFKRGNKMLPNGTSFHIMRHYILTNPQGICSTLKIFT